MTEVLVLAAMCVSSRDEAQLLSQFLIMIDYISTQIYNFSY